ncbi:UDP-N-acetylmuramate--L-alanine ligase [Frankliniella fusca]|uniref:UDP-N-acetylmuramate--L-alanine ligase n=1 Tax=Frankliniella fusca TaxID=407009 RepID=A0AAE1GXC9_9NEOP|nr:UDP-N-acetylmuramate--L-alanine ligase [Frankliniella fusca]
MIKFQFAEIVNEDGSVRRLRYPRAAEYRECLKENLGHLAREVKDFPAEPSHLNFYSTQLNRHIRTGETPSAFLPRSVTDARVRLTPYLRWKHSELRGGKHLTSCVCLKRNGMQCWCPRWGCRGSLGCQASAPGAAHGALSHREPGRPVEPTCCESWGQRAKEADQQLYLVKKVAVERRGLY